MGIANLYVYRSDGSWLFCTANDTVLNNSNIKMGSVLSSNISGSIITLYDTPTKQVFTGNGTITAQNTSIITITFPRGEFVPTHTITDTATSHTATITQQLRDTNWQFPGVTYPSISNLDSIIQNTLIIETLEIGTIAYLKGINPGSAYQTNPYITVIEPDVAALQISDGNGNYWGADANVSSTVINANGIVTAVNVVSSGFGYYPGETLTLSGNNNSGVSITGKCIVDLDGVENGYAADNNGYLSDIIKLQDSKLYQQYSYVILSQRMLETYEKLVRNIIHPAGVALYGQWLLRNDLQNEPSVAESFSITSA